MLAFVHDDSIIVEPCSIPKSWKNPITGTIYINFSNLSLKEMYDMGWKNVDDSEPDHNPMFESVEYGEWYYDKDNDIVKRDHTINNLPFDVALYNAYSVLMKNRVKYETSGFIYNFNNMDLVVQTDAESQAKLASTRIAAENGTRSDNDIWKFKQLNGTNFITQVPNSTIIDISNFVFRKIQDSYNLVGQLSSNMLATGDTATLKTQIENGTINLDPWNMENKS